MGPLNAPAALATSAWRWAIAASTSSLDKRPRADTRPSLELRGTPGSRRATPSPRRPRAVVDRFVRRADDRRPLRRRKPSSSSSTPSSIPSPKASPIAKSSASGGASARRIFFEGAGRPVASTFPSDSSLLEASLDPASVSESESDASSWTTWRVFRKRVGRGGGVARGVGFVGVSRSAWVVGDPLQAGGKKARACAVSLASCPDFPAYPAAVMDGARRSRRDAILVRQSKAWEVWPMA